MKFLFLLFWVCDIIIIFFFSFSLVTAYASGITAHKDKGDMITFWLLFLTVIALVVVAMMLYKKHWHKSATLLAAIPCLSLLFLFLIPIIAYLSGARMN